jgi:predicted transcriptional regulator
VRTLHEQVGVPRGISSNTIQSAMERLYRKGVLRRTKVSHAYVYAPALSRAEFATGVIDGVARALGNVGTRPLLAAFVDHAEKVAPETLDELEAMLQRARARSSE